MAKEQATETHAQPAPAKKAESAPVRKGKEYTPPPGGCHSWGCKAQAHTFNFCDEHYDHFKFGLIKKTGEQVPDYEKKLEHYLAWKAKKKSQKAA